MRIIIRALVVVLCAVSVQGTAYNYETRYPTNGGSDSVLTRLFRLTGYAKLDSSVITTFPFYDTLALDDAYCYKLEHVWFYGTDTIQTELIIPGDGAPTVYHASYLTSGGADSVKARLYANLVTPGSFILVSTFPEETNYALNGSDPYRIIFYWFFGTDTQYSEITLPGTGTGGGGLDPPANPAYIWAYIDIGSGIIDSASGTMIPRDKVTLNLQLIGAQSLNDSVWAYVPTLYTKKTDTDGRAVFLVPSNARLYPAGSYYQLTYSARDRGLSSWGEIRRFWLDSIPGTQNILETRQVR